MARWSQEGIPHKGWRYVDVEDVCEGLAGDNERVYEQCQMCRNENSVCAYPHASRIRW